MAELHMPTKGMHTMSAAVHADQCACFDILDKDALAFPDTSEQDAVVVELSDLTRHQNTNMRNTASRHTLNWSHLKSRHPSFLSMHVTHTNSQHAANIFCGFANHQRSIAPDSHKGIHVN